MKIADASIGGAAGCAADAHASAHRHSLSQQLTELLGKTWLRITLLFLAAFVVHLPSLHGGLIWDDHYLVGDNPFFRSPIFSLEIFRHHLFLDSSSGHYRPTQNLSYMLDYVLWNGDVYGYHLSNTLWHAAAGALLFLLLRRVLGEMLAGGRAFGWANTGAYLIALVWTLHPLHSAAVDYISGRADSLAFFFACGAWLIYLRAAASVRLRGRLSGYAVASLMLLLALCSREIAIVWVILFVVHLLCFSRGASRRHRAFTVIACVMLLSIYAALRSLPESRKVESARDGWSAAARSGLMLRALGDYVRLTVWPANLHMERTVAVRSMFKSQATLRDQFGFGSLTVLGLFAAALLLYGAFKRGPGRVLRCFGGVWFFAGFLPVSNIVDLNATSAEHWMYLPLAGLLIVYLGWAIELPPRALRWAPAVVIAFAVALGVRSTIRSTDWLSAQVFYERTVAAGGWSPRVALNLAVIYGDQGRFEESRALLHRTLAIWPGYPQAQSYLGVIMGRQGAAESDRMLAKAAAPSPDQVEYPRSWVAAVQLARRHVELGRDDEALRVLGAARERNPKVWALARMEADILQRTNRTDAALQVVEKFVDKNWWQYSAFLALGKLKAQQDDAPAALAALKHASRLDIRETEALNMIVRIQMRAKNLTAAHAVQRRAVSRQPDEPSQYMLFSEVLMEMGRTEEARRARETAESLQQSARGSA